MLIFLQRKNGPQFVNSTFKIPNHNFPLKFVTFCDDDFKKKMEMVFKKKKRKFFPYALF